MFYYVYFDDPNNIGHDSLDVLEIVWETANCRFVSGPHNRVQTNLKSNENYYNYLTSCGFFSWHFFRFFWTLPLFRDFSSKKSYSCAYRKVARCRQVYYSILHSFGQRLYCKCLPMTKWAENQVNHQNFDPSLLPKKLWLLFMGMKQKKKLKKRIQNGRLKNLCFIKPSILNIFSRKFYRLVLGAVK